MALAYFKLAIIAAGIDFRRRMSDQAPRTADASDRARGGGAADLPRAGRTRQAASAASASSWLRPTCVAFLGRARADWKIRAVPTANGESARRTTPPAEIATPIGRLQCQPKKKVADSCSG